MSNESLKQAAGMMIDNMVLETKLKKLEAALKALKQTIVMKNVSDKTKIEILQRDLADHYEIISTL